MPTPRMLDEWGTALAGGAAWTPASLGSDLLAWYDPSNAPSVTSSGSPARVSQLDDLSGNGRHVSQGTGTKQFYIGTKTINGLATLDEGSLAAVGLSNASFGAVAPPITVFCVHRDAMSAFYQHCVISETPWVGVAYRFFASVGGGAHDRVQLRWYFNNVQYNFTSDTNAHQDTILYASTTSVRRDGSDVSGSALSLTVTPALDYFTIGDHNSSPNLAGVIGEIFVVQGATSGADRTSAEAYLKAKWGTP